MYSASLHNTQHTSCTVNIYAKCARTNHFKEVEHSCTMYADRARAPNPTAVYKMVYGWFGLAWLGLASCFMPYIFRMGFAIRGRNNRIEFQMPVLRSFSTFIVTVTRLKKIDDVIILFEHGIVLLLNTCTLYTESWFHRRCVCPCGCACACVVVCTIVCMFHRYCSRFDVTYMSFCFYFCIFFLSEFL